MSSNKKVPKKSVPRMIRMTPTGPRQFRANPEITRTYRFTSTSGTAKAISPSDLLCAAGVIAVTNILGYPMSQAVKVRSIEIWTPPAAQGAAATCSVLWPAGTQSQPREVSDTTVSVSNPAHIRTGPPALSLASFWNTGAGTLLFTVTAPSGSIIDVTLSLVLNDNFVAGGAAATLVGATVGNGYYCALDSATAAGSVYPPVSLTQL
jgi:hypothetical protein